MTPEIYRNRLRQTEIDGEYRALAIRHNSRVEQVVEAEMRKHEETSPEIRAALLKKYKVPETMPDAPAASPDELSPSVKAFLAAVAL